MALLETKNLSVAFGGLWAVNGVDFQMEAGDVVGLIGPNGSGKTTFLNLISGLYQPTKGTIRLAGEDITNLKPYEIFRKGIGRTYQSSRLCWNLSVGDNVLLGLNSKHEMGFWSNVFRAKKSDAEIFRHLEKALEVLHYFNPQLVEKRYELAQNISHIDRRRVELSRILVSDPKVILIDELTAGLNQEETLRIMEDIQKVKTWLPDIGMIIIEHDMNVMQSIPNKIVVFNAGEKIAQGSYEEIVQNEQVINAYLGGAAV